MIVKAVITTLDNLPLLRQQVSILREELLVDEIVVVNNGSIDGTREWLCAQPEVNQIHRENKGAGPGRNAGLDRAERFDYVLMLDGGIRPLRGGVARMIEYLERHPEVHVIGVDLPQTINDEEAASREWPDPIRDEDTYRNWQLSQTHYCLARAAAFHGLRFSEEGPFAEPGWGVDDDEMAYRWFLAGIIVHVVTNVHPYRRASGSFPRLFRETGIWPNQYGSVYEERLVWCQQNFPQFAPGVQWGEPWLTVVVRVGDEVEKTIELIKRIHDRLRVRRFLEPWNNFPNPYSVVAWCPAGHRFMAWAKWRRLRQHHGDTIVVGTQTVKRTPESEALWTGDFRVWCGDDYFDAIRPNACYFCLVSTLEDFDYAAALYDSTHPDRANPPAALRVQLTLTASGLTPGIRRV